MRTAKLLKFTGGLLILTAMALPFAAPTSRQYMADFLIKIAVSVYDAQQAVSGDPTVGDAALPILEQANRAIPGNLKQIYTGLNRGDLGAVRPYLSQRLANNYGKLDGICKPFTYRAHYIEAVIERPRGWFEVRVRALFQPLDEHAYTLAFFASQAGQFVLDDVNDPTDDWFGPEKEAATELARNFVYAAKAGNANDLARLVVPSIPAPPFVTEPCWQQFFYTTKEPRINGAQLTSYKGLKMEVLVYLSPAIGFGYSALGRSRFLVDRVGDEYKIVSADPRGDYNMLYLPESECPDKSVLHQVEDPNLEEETLKRFGLVGHGATPSPDGD